MSALTENWQSHIRRRPIMYVGEAGPQRLLHELTLLAIANARTTAAPCVEVELLSEAGFTVRDNGPGRAFSVVLTTISSPDYWYQAANAVSRRLVIERQRGGQLWREEHAAGAVVVPPTPVGAASGTGTAITFWPDPQVFHDLGPIDSAQVNDLLHALACLHPTGTFVLRDRRGQTAIEERFEAPEGLGHLIRLLESPFSPPVHPTIVRGSLRTDAGEATVAMRWCRDVEDFVILFANDRRMPYGGTPVVGLRTGVPHAIRRFARTLPAGTVVPTGRAYRSGLVAYVAVRVEEPMFIGATHGQLGNREAVPLVAAAARQALESFLRDHPDEAQAILRHLLDPRRADPKTGMPL
jgi:DNA gyrase subunit B